MWKRRFVLTPGTRFFRLLFGSSMVGRLEGRIQCVPRHLHSHLFTPVCTLFFTPVYTCSYLFTPVDTCSHLFSCHTYHSRTTFFFVLPTFRHPPPPLLPPGDAVDTPAAVRVFRRVPPIVVVDDDPASDDVVQISYA